MLRFTLLTVAAIALFAPPAHADVTVKSVDGTMELTLPNGWREVKPEGSQTQIVATDGRGARVAVRSFSKEDFKDVKTVAGYSAGRLKLIENPEQKFQDVDVNGKPAVRVELTGTEPNGMKRGYIITVFEVDGRYIDVVASSHASAFTKNQQVLEGFAKQLVLAASPTAASPPATSPTAASPPATNPTSTNSPKQPPQPQPPVRH